MVKQENCFLFMYELKVFFEILRSSPNKERDGARERERERDKKEKRLH